MELKHLFSKSNTPFSSGFNPIFSNSWAPYVKAGIIPMTYPWDFLCWCTSLGKKTNQRKMAI